jgi:pyroglutamyl-peptidase
MKRLLITGFSPFGGDGINPAWQAVAALPETVGAWALYKRELPATFRGAPKGMEEAIREVEPDAVLMIGLAAGRAAVTPERQGVNEKSARIPDNEGAQPQNEPVIPGGPEILYSTLPVEDMAEAIREIGVPAQVSESAGRFVCNALLYSTLNALEQAEAPVPAAFIHVPATPELAAGRDMPTLPLDRIVAALRAAIEAI